MIDIFILDKKYCWDVVLFQVIFNILINLNLKK